MTLTAVATKNGSARRATVTEIVEMVANALEADVYTEEGVKRLVEATGLKPQYWYRWRANGSGISATHALLLLRKANLLRQPGAEEDAPGSSGQILQGLVDAVADLTKSHRQALEDLAEVRTRLERAEAELTPAAASPKTKKARSA